MPLDRANLYPVGVTPTLADVAREAGVHPGTASRALKPNPGGRVAPETISRVRAAAEKLGYQPNALAQGLRTRRSFSVGLLIPDLTNPLFPPIVRGVEEVLRPQGLVALVANTDNDQACAQRLFSALQARQCDGFVLATAHRVDPLVELAAETGAPAVLVNRSTDRTRLPTVAGDEAAGIGEAVAHLVDLGHRRIAHIAGPQDISTGYIRYRAFLDAVDRFGLSAADCPVVTADGYNEDAGHRAVAALPSGAQRPTGIVAANDLVALGVLDGLGEQGVDCPRDVSVVGFNDMPYLARIRPALTTIQLPKREMGVHAARLLMERIGDSTQSDARLVLLPCPLIVRGSTAPPPVHAS
jgi:LacI family transcriptional regulator